MRAPKPQPAWLGLHLLPAPEMPGSGQRAASGPGDTSHTRPSCTSRSAQRASSPSTFPLGRHTTDSSKLRSAASSQEHAGQVVNREKIMRLRRAQEAVRFILLGRRGVGSCLDVGLAPGQLLSAQVSPLSPEQDPGGAGGPGRGGTGTGMASHPSVPRSSSHTDTLSFFIEQLERHPLPQSH